MIEEHREWFNNQDWDQKEDTTNEKIERREYGKN